MNQAAPFDPVAAFTGLVVLVKSMLGALVFPACAMEAVALYGYLGRTGRRFETLVARIRSGKLPPLPLRPRAAPAAQAAPPEAAAEPAPAPAEKPKIPRQRAWLLHNVRGTPGAAAWQLARMLDQSETQALIAADPVRMGRLLRPLWRLFTADPLPENLRLPPRPRRKRPRARPVFSVRPRPWPPRRAPDAAPPASTYVPPTLRRRNE